jgi:hypothetical protein
VLDGLARQVDHRQALLVRADDPQYGADAAALPEEVDAEPPETGDRVGQVDLVLRLERGPLRLVAQRVDERRRDLGTQLRLGDGYELTVEARHGGQADVQV